MHAAPLPWLVIGRQTVAAMPMHAPSSAHQAQIMARDGMARAYGRGCRKEGEVEERAARGRRSVSERRKLSPFLKRLRRGNRSRAEARGGIIHRLIASHSHALRKRDRERERERESSSSRGGLMNDGQLGGRGTASSATRRHHHRPIHRAHAPAASGVAACAAPPRTKLLPPAPAPPPPKACSSGTYAKELYLVCA